MHRHLAWWTCAVATLSTLLLSACTSTPSAPRSSSSASSSTPSQDDIAAWAQAFLLQGTTEQTPWEHYLLPTKRPTLFSVQHQQGRYAMRASAESSASMLRRKLRVEPAALGTLQFSWLVESHIPDANMAVAATDDAPVRVVLAFEGDRSRFSPRNAMLSELAWTVTGEPLPYATLIYSWCMHCMDAEVIVNPRTDRIRTLVVESGGGNLGQWRDYDRNLRADFETVFGEPPGALVAIGIMTDSDNTMTHTKAWYGPLKLVPLPAVP